MPRAELLSSLPPWQRRTVAVCQQREMSGSLRAYGVFPSGPGIAPSPPPPLLHFLFSAPWNSSLPVRVPAVTLQPGGQPCAVGRPQPDQQQPRHRCHSHARKTARLIEPDSPGRCYLLSTPLLIMLKALPHLQHSVSRMTLKIPSFLFEEGTVLQVRS